MGPAPPASRVSSSSRLRCSSASVSAQAQGGVRRPLDQGTELRPLRLPRRRLLRVCSWLLFLTHEKGSVETLDPQPWILSVS